MASITKFVVLFLTIVLSCVGLQLFEEAASSQAGSVDNLRALLADPAVDVNVLTENGESILHLACIWGNEEKISLLLKHGADPNMRAKHTTSLDMTV